MALETGLCDRTLYHGLTSFLVPHFDRLIPWNVFSHRHDYLRGDSKYMFKRAIPAWKDFVGSVKSATNATSYLMVTDIANYFENISLDALRRALLRLLPSLQATPAQKNQIRNHIALLFSCLSAWAYESTRGLPQNRDASSFLANMYMQLTCPPSLVQG